MGLATATLSPDFARERHKIFCVAKYFRLVPESEKSAIKKGCVLIKKRSRK